jgi:hypothetical protein
MTACFHIDGVTCDNCRQGTGATNVGWPVVNGYWSLPLDYTPQINWLLNRMIELEKKVAVLESKKEAKDE